jgi:glycosyltransferase involved in cell wall biosynthesis
VKLVNQHHAPRPSVTAVIPAHNAEDTIARAVSSALAQTYPSLEIIVVDDCSSDRTAEIVEAFVGAGVRLLRLPSQQGASRARNAGIEAATSELIAFLDSDDEWLPSKIAKQLALITGTEHFAFVSCSSRFISAVGEDLGDLYRWRRPVAGPEVWKSLLARNTIATPSVLAWRRDLIELGGFDPRFRICEDQDMWIRLALRGAVGYVDEFLVYVHDRPDSLSRRDVGISPRIAIEIVERHIREQQLKLTASEVRRIRGERLEWLGRA